MRAPTTLFRFCAWNVGERVVGDADPYNAFLLLRMERRTRHAAHGTPQEAFPWGKVARSAG